MSVGASSAPRLTSKHLQSRVGKTVNKVEDLVADLRTQDSVLRHERGRRVRHVLANDGLSRDHGLFVEDVVSERTVTPEAVPVELRQESFVRLVTLLPLNTPGPE